jgi:hypothetical protein
MEKFFGKRNNIEKFFAVVALPLYLWPVPI